jgi:hypothetical protein
MKLFSFEIYFMGKIRIGLNCQVSTEDKVVSELSLNRLTRNRNGCVSVIMVYQLKVDSLAFRSYKFTV